MLTLFALLVTGALAVDNLNEDLQRKIYVDITETVWEYFPPFKQHFGTTVDVYVTVPPPEITDVTIYVPPADATLTVTKETLLPATPSVLPTSSVESTTLISSHATATGVTTTISPPLSSSETTAEVDTAVGITSESVSSVSVGSEGVLSESSASGTTETTASITSVDSSTPVLPEVTTTPEESGITTPEEPGITTPEIVITPTLPATTTFVNSAVPQPSVIETKTQIIPSNGSSKLKVSALVFCLLFGL